MSFQSGQVLCKLTSRSPSSSFFFKAFFFFFNFLILFIFIFGCVGSSSLCEGFLQLRQAGATLHRGARALPPSWPLLLRSTGSRCAGSAVVAHGPSCSAARGIFPDRGPNPCPLHWQADSQPLRHLGSPKSYVFNHRVRCVVIFNYGLICITFDE